MTTVNKYIYGEKRIVKAAEVRKDTKHEVARYKEERKYDALDWLAAAKFFPPTFIIMMTLNDKKETYPAEWTAVNTYKVSLQDGSRFKFQLFNQDMDLRPGDIFVVCSVGKQLTYIKCRNNGVVFLDQPVESPNWETFKDIRKKQLKNQAEVYAKNAKNFALFASKVYYKKSKRYMKMLKNKTVLALKEPERLRLPGGDK